VLWSLGAVGNYLMKTLEVMRLFQCRLEMVEVAVVVIVKAAGFFFVELEPGQEEAEGWIEVKVPLWELQHRRWIS